MKRHVFASGKSRDREGKCWCGKPEHKPGEFFHTKQVDENTWVMTYNAPVSSQQKLDMVLKTIEKDKDAN